MSTQLVLVNDLTLMPTVSSSTTRYTLQPPGEGDNVFERGFIQVRLSSEMQPGQQLFVTGYTEHEVRPAMPFPGVGIGMNSFTHEEGGPYAVDLRTVCKKNLFHKKGTQLNLIKINSSFKFRYEYGQLATFFQLPSDQIRRGVLKLHLFFNVHIRCQFQVSNLLDALLCLFTIHRLLWE